MTDTTWYHVIKERRASFYRPVVWIDADGEYPEHFMDTETGEIILACAAHVAFVTDNEQVAMNEAVELTRQER